MECINDKIVTTRKPHTCWGCMREFPAGSRMHRNTCVEDEICTSYWCVVCDEIMHELDEEDGIEFGGIINNEPERYNEALLKWGKSLPGTIMLANNSIGTGHITVEDL